MKTEIVTQFINASNEHDFSSLDLLLADDAKFVDSAGKEYIGKAAIISAWKANFELFPDFTITIDKQVHHGTTIGAFGTVSGSYPEAKETDNKLRWKIQAAWKAIVLDTKIKHWQIFSDSSIPNKIIKNSSGEAQDESKIVGLGGVFFKSKNPKELCNWYDKHLGTNFGTNTWNTFKWHEHNNTEVIGRTEFSVFSEKSDYFSPSEKPFMFNFRVSDLDSFLNKLRKEGVQVLEKVERYEYGNFGWIVDLEGNKIEIWEPVDAVLEAFDKQNS